ncbi:hypothetical protein BBJ28_00007491 [Nothophytophthora sp. Chile5]|nr:hypothetical protein BBJ28_00007491 [Nothophytophthora sp. Chile5]
MASMEQGEAAAQAHVASSSKTDEDAATVEEGAETAEMFVFTVAKAGMKDVDKEHVKQVVHEMSKDSAYYQKSLLRNEKVDERVAAMRQKLTCLTAGQHLRLQGEVDARVAQLEATRDLTRTVVMVDMDMFYAAVEMRDNPKLRDVPLAVGGTNMISTTNYLARKHGVRAAMPGFIGKELCPELQFVPVDMPKYARVAEQIRAVFAEYDPSFEAFSLDEACLDLTDFMATHWRQYLTVAAAGLRSEEAEQSEEDEQQIKGDGGELQWVSTAVGREAIASAIVRELRQKIFERTQLTASAGIAVNAMIAKICSDMNKPNGQYALPFTRERVVGFIRELPVRKIGGIGQVMEKTLGGALDVHTGGELFAQRGKLFHLFSEKTASWLLRTSLGLQERRERQERKSFSCERTFRSMSDPQQLEAKCLEMCTKLAEDLQAANRAGKNVTLKLKSTDFAVRSRSVSLVAAVSTADELYAHAVELLRRELPLTLRLMGVRAAALVPRHHNTTPTGAESNSSLAVGESKKRQLVIKKFAKPMAADSATATESGALTEIRHSDDAATGALPDAGVCSRPSVHLGVTRKSVMETFLSKASISGDGTVDHDHLHPCPICGKLLNARSNVEVNAHMDVCVLDKHSPSASSLGKSDATKSKKRSTLQAFTPHRDAGSNSDTGEEDQEQLYPCPICGKLLNARKNLAVNAHMDACVLGERSSSSSVRTSTSKKRRKRALPRASTSIQKADNSLHVFFRKNYND